MKKGCDKKRSILHTLATVNRSSLDNLSNPRIAIMPFRGEPASFGFEWHFNTNHNSFVDYSTLVGSDLHLVPPKLHP
ncbi:hypothetical protein Goarm_021378, partial [Gossypium armourianum]|nr:hypothetical protein [Gossypium armourianum]